jgi:hypothetical protein
LAIFILKDCNLFVAEFDLTADTSQTRVEHSAAELDHTTMGNSSRKRLAGIEDVSVAHEGFVEHGTGLVEDALFGRVAAANAALTMIPANSGAIGDRAYLTEAGHFTFSPGASVGEVYAFSAEARGSERLVRGEILQNKTARTVTFTATGRQLGAVSATQRLYAALHVFTVSGTTPTLDVIIESDNAVGFPSPATQITLAQKTAKGSEFKSVAGAITDDWFRVKGTIAGTTPSFTLAVAVGVK